MNTSSTKAPERYLIRAMGLTVNRSNDGFWVIDQETGQRWACATLTDAIQTQNTLNRSK